MSKKEKTSKKYSVSVSVPIKVANILTKFATTKNVKVRECLTSMIQLLKDEKQQKIVDAHIDTNIKDKKRSIILDQISNLKEQLNAI